MRNKKLQWALGGLALVVLGLWVAGFVLVPERNPEQRYTGSVLSPEGDKVLRRACYDCHSNETVWPWYSYVPGVNILVSHDVKEGRRELNFSKWESFSAKKKGHKLRESWLKVKKDKMPLPIYLVMHGDARLTDADKEQIRSDIATLYGEQYTKPKPKKKKVAVAEAKPAHDDDEDGHDHEHEE